ncbi:MAG: ribosome-associated translation inhibitor RaiA [Deltaproteobacteria bacterium]|nr:ribosome-associated translation inhibitor RaiA [Deltaproteobacteria bacterium]
MHINITFRHLDSSDALKEHAEERTEKLLKYLVEPVEIHWMLSVEKIRHKAEATIKAKDINITAHEESQDMYVSIDKVASRLEKQLRKHKEKIKNHKFGEDASASPRYATSEDSEEDSEE